MGGRRGNNEGSIFQRSSDGRWLGVAIVGYTSQGRIVRKTVTAKTRVEVQQKLKQLQRQLDDGLPAPDATLTVAQLFERWYCDVLRHQVAVSAADNYKSIADRHITPSLGRRRLVDLTTAEVDRLISLKSAQSRNRALVVARTDEGDFGVFQGQRRQMGFLSATHRSTNGPAVGSSSASSPFLRWPDHA